MINYLPHGERVLSSGRTTVLHEPPPGLSFVLSGKERLWLPPSVRRIWGTLVQTAEILRYKSLVTGGLADTAIRRSCRLLCLAYWRSKRQRYLDTYPASYPLDHTSPACFTTLSLSRNHSRPFLSQDVRLTREPGCRGRESASLCLSSLVIACHCLCTIACILQRRLSLRQHLAVILQLF